MIRAREISGGRTHAIEAQQHHLGSSSSSSTVPLTDDGIVLLLLKTEDRRSINPMFRLPNRSAQNEVIHISHPSPFVATKLNLLGSHIEVLKVIPLGRLHLQ